MGLDITAYKNLKVVEKPQFNEYGELENWDTEWKPGASMEWSEKHFPGRGEGINSNTVYTWEENFTFRAGSYSGYNLWRSKLAKFAGGSDFNELINFADNEGVIGFVVSKKLADDFNKNEAKAKEFAETFEDGDWWFDKYQSWKKAFEIASENGAIDFH